MIKELLSLKDEKYAIFQRRLIPNIPPESIIGVRTPQLRSLAKELEREGRQQELYSHLPMSILRKTSFTLF